MAASRTNRELAKLFDRLAKLMELRGESVFKAIAFQKVGRTLDALSRDVKAIFDEGGLKALREVEGIGDSSAKVIADWLEKGHSPDYDELAATVPAGLIPMLEVPGLGPKTARLVWQERQITDLDQLSKALDDGTLEGLRGIGKKKIEQIREGLAMRQTAGRRHLLSTGRRVAGAILEELRQLEGVERAEAAGSLRRGRETVGDLDLLVLLPRKADPRTGRAILERFTQFPQVERVLGQGQTKCSVITKEGMQVDCRVVPHTSWGAALIYFTGSKEHNVVIRGMAQERGHTLNEWGLFEEEAWKGHERKPGEAPTLRPVAGATEEEVYRWLGLEWIAPELREARGEVEAAAEGRLPKLITRDDYRGDLHLHTSASDGLAGIEEMARAAKALGHNYIAVTDHSPSQRIANGLDAARLRKHIQAIREVSDKLKGFSILAGSEVDILTDGTLDYPDEVLADLDWVVASPHASLRQDESRATDRLLRAIDNPYVNCIGHPTGRLINSRSGLSFDFQKVFERAAASGTAMEINASYERLDLSDVHARAAIEAGCTLCINTDAHSPEPLADLEGGIATARRAWATPADVLNSRPVAQVRKFVAARRPR